MGQPQVAIIVCARNNRDILSHCLIGIREQRYHDWQCVVVDDASTDGTVDWLRLEYPWVGVIRNDQNCGPSFSRNLAANRVTADYLAFLDSDVELDPNWLNTTVDFMQTAPPVGIVGGKLIFASRPSLIHSYGGALGRLGLGWDAHEGELESALRELVECLWVSSAAMLIQKTVFEEAGGFDETFFYGYEDSDLGWRANLLGYRVVSIPDARAFHRTRHTISKMGDQIIFHQCKNRLQSILKNYSRKNIVKYLPLYVAYSLIDIALRGSLRPKLEALFWNVARLGSISDKRKRIQERRIVTDHKIEKLLSKRLLPPVCLGERRRRAAALA